MYASAPTVLMFSSAVDKMEVCACLICAVWSILRLFTSQQEKMTEVRNEQMHLRKVDPETLANIYYSRWFRPLEPFTIAAISG